MADRSLELALRIRALVDGAESIDDLRKKLGGLGDEIEQAANPTDEFNRGLRDLDDAGQQAGKGVKAAADPLDEFKQLVGEIAVAALAKQIFDLNDQMTALKRGFDVITGSSTATTQALDFVRGVADRLGASSADLAQSFLKITAAAKGTQLEGAATEQIFSALAGAMSTVGASAQGVDSAMNAVAQMMSKGVISAEELRGQLGDVLPGAAQQAAQALLATNAEFSQMLESGQVIASEFLPKFAVQLERAMGGGTGQVESFNASWQRLANQLADVATGPIGKGFTDFAALLVDKLGVLIRSAGAVSDVIGAVGKAIGGLAAGEAGAALEDFGQAVVDATGKLFGFQTEAQAAAERQKQMAAELKALTPEIDRFQNAVARQELKELPESLQAAIAAIRKTGDAAAATEQAITDFMSAPSKNLNLDGVLKLATSLKAVGNEAAQAGDQITETLGESLSKLTHEQLTALEAQARKAMAEASNNANTRRAFAELGQVIEGTVLARLEKLGVDGPEALRGVSTAATEAMENFAALADNAELSADTIDAAFSGALDALDNPAELEAFREEIIALGESGRLSGEQVERALLLIRQRVQEVADDPAFDALAENLARIREETEREIAVAERQAATNQARIQAAQALAKAKGDEAAAARLAADAAQLEVAQAEQRIAQMRQQQALIDLHIQKLYAQANADGIYSDAEREAIAALRDKSGALEADIAQMTAHLPVLEREARQTEVMAGPIGQLSRLYAEQAQAHDRAADASERYYQTQLNEIDGALRVAQARGDEAKAAELLQQKQRLLIDQADAKARADAQAVEDAEKKLDAYKLEAQATDGLDEAEKENIKTLEDAVAAKREAAQQSADNADATREEARANEEAAAAAKEQAAAQKEAAYQAEQEAVRVAEKTLYAAKNFDHLSERGKAALQAIGTGYQTAHGTIEQLNRAILEQTQALDGAAGAELAAVERLKKLQAAAAGVGPEADRAKEALANLARGGGAGLRGITAEGEQAISTLEGIKAAAESAAQSLASMANDFQREMLQIQGNQRALLDADHEENLRRLKELHDAAGNAGDDEYNQAVTRANQLHQLKLAQLREQEEEQRRRDRDSAGGTVEDLDRITEAAERTKAALSGVAGVSLAGLAGQARDLKGHFQGLNELL